MKRYIILTAMAALAGGLATHMPAHADEARQTFRPTGIPATLPVTGTELVDGKVVRSRYYRYGDGEPGQKPIVIFVPGSGCDGALALGRDGKAHAGLEMFALPRLRDVDVYVVEPPGIPRQFAAPEHGLSEGCPAAFLAANRFEDVMAAYGRALHDITDGRVAGRPVMIVGTSDGALMAAALAAGDTATTHLVLISGFGTSQVADQLRQRVDQAFSDRVDEKGVASVREYRSKLEVAQKHPQSPVLWQGQPMSRWSSSAQISGVDLLRRLPATVHLLLVQGGRDTSWSPDAFRQGVATLLASGRGMAIRYIACGDHQLMCAGEPPGPEHLKETIEQALRWLDDGHADASWTTFDAAPMMTRPAGRQLPVGYGEERRSR
ncbi:hypothetical protein [Luteibacter sp. 22Crub2.1]|uniref:hypothetical protein n=1 Tax=Luteibacter sp. 22Crub2.1 TaxID=1283288 RepID=UPI0009A57890|nr:hypothetical protein [Luteibacter sp. 22Crub2.1]SKB71184.1 Poly(3-hydroxybutyrate) depolymerase [Luteibacter sp. 22Crub2.1]